ncbi:MAG: radical SAM protein [Armatimonadota bacterium]|nr:MAG: radical SAM protein [Armatimonadota bacterium]
MSSEYVTHRTFDGHQYTHLFTARDPAGAVVFRADLMQQVLCSPRGAELMEAALSGEGSLDSLPREVRDFVSRSVSELPTSGAHSARYGLSDVASLFLVPTFDCQLACEYCRITRVQGQQAGFRLSPEAAREAIDRVLGPIPSGKRRTLVFFGGEPLLVPETVFSAISHVREGPGGCDTDIMLQTNGVAIDAETAEFLAANDVFVYLSLDGVADVHNRHREFLTGEGSYEASAAGYRKAKAHGCCVGVSATMTKETADRFASSFEAMLSDLVPEKCGAVTHLHPLTAARSPHQCAPGEAAEILMRTFLAARERGIYHQQMCERVGPLVTGAWRRYACAGCGGKVVVAPDGKAGICEYNAGDGRSYVPIHEFSEDTVADFLQWAARSPVDTRECRQCPALPTCGGGCAYDSQELMGNALKFDPWLCETNVQVFHWLMHDLLSQLRHKLTDRDFHVVTAEEREVVLGRIPLGDALAPIARIIGRSEAAEAAECPAE